MLKRGENIMIFRCAETKLFSDSNKKCMKLRIIELRNFVANLSVWVVWFKRKLEKTESYMSQTAYKF